MKQREIVLRRVARKCGDFARQLSYHRSLTKYKDSFRLNFWKTVFNNAIDLAVLDWLHLFGSDKDDLHWNRIIKDTQNFKSGLLMYLGLDDSAWKDYRKTVKEYRDKDVAHIEVRPVGNVPNLNTALKAADYYYEHVYRELEPLGDYSGWSNDLFDYYSRNLEEAEEIVSLAYNSTKEMEEKVF